MRSLAQWAGALCINVAPVAAFYIWTGMWNRIRVKAWTSFYTRLPNTTHRGKPPPRTSSQEPDPLLVAEGSVPTTRTPDAPAQLQTTETSQTSQTPQTSPTPAAVESQTPVQTQAPEPPPRSVDSNVTAPAAASSSTSARRPSTVSARGEDYPSDEDDHEPLNPTVISFDIEATDSSEAPPGLWSAELRPSVGPETRSPTNQEPIYFDTQLTRIPPIFAAYLLSSVASSLITAPLETVALRLAARGFRHGLGLPVDDIQSLSIFSNVTWRLVANYIGVEFVYMTLMVESWATITAFSQLWHYTEDEWKEAEEEKKLERR